MYTFSHSADPDQRAPVESLWSGSELFEKYNVGFSAAGYLHPIV